MNRHGMHGAFSCRRFVSGLFCLGALLLTCSAASALSVQYQYDAASRLTTVSYSNGTTIAFTYDAAGNMLSRSVTSETQCPECSSSPVILRDVTFGSDVDCTCSDGESIVIGDNVTVKSGADVSFRAPKVTVQSQVHMEEGASVSIDQP